MMLWKHCPKTVVHQDTNVSIYPPTHSHGEYGELMTLLICSHKKIGKHVLTFTNIFYCQNIEITIVLDSYNVWSNFAGLTLFISLVFYIKIYQYK